MRQFLIFVLFAFVVSGCASMFTIGEEDFACKGNAVGGVCGDPMGIYKAKESILEQYEKDKTKQNSKQDNKSVEIRDDKAGNVNSGNYSIFPLPVRKAEEIRRVYIYPFQDSKNNYIMGFYVFTIVNKGQWVMPDGREVENAFEINQ
ncbi:type IV conjugative transfer system lipoprotein TraV [Thermodesulfovibrio sp. TK110]